MEFTRVKVFPKVVAGVDEGTTGVLFLTHAVEVGGVADLGFDLFFAVAEVVIGDEGDDDAAPVSGGDFEGDAVVIAFVFALPEHAVTALTGGSLFSMRKAEVFFYKLYEMGS